MTIESPADVGKLDVRPQRRRRGPGKPMAILIAVIVLGFLYLPPAVMAIFSLNSSKVETLPIKELTLDWYRELVGNDKLKSALFYSLQISITAVVISLVLGTAFALIFTRRFKFSRVIELAVILPMLLPGMVLGVSLQLAFRLVGLTPGFLTMAVAHCVFLVPIVIFVIGQRLASLDPSLGQASRDLGASAIRGFFTVTLPLLRTALMAAALLAFTLSFDELAVSFFVSGFDQTLPVYVWSLLRLGFTPQVNAIFTILALLSVGAVVIAFRVLRKNTKALARNKAGVQVG
jgi:spermidine/putrescine transport system permease protein